MTIECLASFPRRYAQSIEIQDTRILRTVESDQALAGQIRNGSADRVERQVQMVGNISATHWKLNTG